MGLASSSDVLLGERVPCFTALRQEYLLSACMLTRSMFFLEKSREHVFERFSRNNPFPIA